MDDRPFDAPNLLRHAAGRLHGFPDISEDLLDAADEIERLRAEAAGSYSQGYGAGYEVGYEAGVEARTEMNDEQENDR